MKQRAWIYGLLLLTAGCATQLPQTLPAGTPAQVPAPEIRVGDHWRYSVHDGFTKLPRGTVEYRVRAAQGDTITVDVRNEERESTELYARDGSWLQRPATNMQVFSYSPAYQAFAFPLVPGKTWSARSTATDPVDGRRFPVILKGAVLGWERIKVPAGEFDALKVRRYVFLDYWQQGVRGQSIIVEHDWYVPAIRQAARRETSSQFLSYLFSQSYPGFRPVGGDHDGGGPRYIQDDWLVYELVSHSQR